MHFKTIHNIFLYLLTCRFYLQHFVCAKCEKPFLGHRHYEKRGLAYCETHYHQLFGNLCFVCNQVIAGDGKCSIPFKYMFGILAKLIKMCMYLPSLNWRREKLIIELLFI